MNDTTLHIRLTSALYGMQIIFLSGLTSSMFILGLPLFGALTGFATICLLLTSAILFLRNRTTRRNEQKSLNSVISVILAACPGPTSIFKSVDDNMKLVFSNSDTGYTEMEDYLYEIDPMERVIIRDSMSSGNQISTVILTKNPDGNLVESEISFKPIHVDGELTYWVGQKTVLKELSANVIPINTLRSTQINPE